MINTKYFKGKKITILGLARSGFACANLLHNLGAFVRVTDVNDNMQTRGFAMRFEAKEIQVELGGHSKDFISSSDLVVVSPGVPAEAEPLIWAKELAKPVISEIELASMLCPAQIIAVTGSNGKTTVTTLIGKILEKAGKRVFVCGNIGNPFCGEVEKLKTGDFVVLEVSSFQLETIKNFKPKIAVILNLTPNHLDRYADMREYLEAKKRIFMNQRGNDFLVLNADDPVLKDICLKPKSKVVFFSKQENLNPNQSAVIEVSKILGVRMKDVLAVFQDFKGLEHRMEEVAQINGVKFINDSKATTADSAIWAISNINAPLILIAGGRHKGIDYKVILGAARNKVKQAFLIGEAKDIIASDLSGGFPVEKVASLKEAVIKSFAQARPGDYVLFSPMCSSFDMFRDYQQRGEAFKRIVLDLPKEFKETHG
jgi:UDP-N-acetylmuramoylalanine--D-glutamate ligase